MSYTPGPWTVDAMEAASDDPTETYFRLRADGRDLTDFAENDDTARLIAAAPELLESANAILRSTDYCDDERPLMRALRAAAAKATNGA